ncbi:hypothetical protein TCAL_04014 [Tigriopus californicus]|uniref:VWFC domain-containing protein n=1 Tax=Tigriopus californicus TaxID=6832 RepID=A0A553ND54_TIGCA|nr:integral membrane protein DGCR2/IDD-like [Tigriopus californicus]TRY63345.1 hypothetical protein TCAL_04014 [Tigriopus californicus]|eukprot:TCALIF_04014-PA protein Name:"Similar to Dgcr2 Integral membrane protein DGCR2/IDD (Mus musculus)" AED:0.08 eAED:0.21 QI:0/-1/0/1/-1/1/1/0/416
MSAFRNLSSESGLTPLIVNNRKGCIDLDGKPIPHGFLFAPGPDECLVCTCSDGLQSLCRTVLCSPPPDCKSLRVGNQCCQWICLDDIHPHGGSDFDPHNLGNSGVVDIKLRLVASAVMAIFSLALLAFLIYRLRKRKLNQRREQRSRESDDDMSVDSVAQAHSLRASSYPMSVMPTHRSYWHHLAWWKPNHDMFEQRPAPPSYDDAMMQARGHENDSLGSSSGSEAPPYSEIHLDPVIPEPSEWYCQQNQSGSPPPVPQPHPSPRPSAIPGAALVLPSPAPTSPRLNHVLNSELAQDAAAALGETSVTHAQVIAAENDPTPVVVVNPCEEDQVRRAKLPKVIRRMRARSREGIVIPNETNCQRYSLQLHVDVSPTSETMPNLRVSPRHCGQFGDAESERESTGAATNRITTHEEQI